MAGSGESGETGALPDRLGYWPAAAILLAFTWWELVSPVGSDPGMLALAALAYTVYMLFTIRRWGPASQLTTWDGFGAYNHLMGAMGPLGVGREGCSGAPRLAEGAFRRWPNAPVWMSWRWS